MKLLRDVLCEGNMTLKQAEAKLKKLKADHALLMPAARTQKEYDAVDDIHDEIKMVEKLIRDMRKKPVKESTTTLTTTIPAREKPRKPPTDAPKKKYPAIGTLAWEKLPKWKQEELLVQRGHKKPVKEGAGETAQQAYSRLSIDAMMLLKQIKQQLMIHNQRHEQNLTDWGFPGDIGKVVEELNEILTFLKTGEEVE